MLLDGNPHRLVPDREVTLWLLRIRDAVNSRDMHAAILDAFWLRKVLRSLWKRANVMRKSLGGYPVTVCRPVGRSIVRAKYTPNVTTPETINART